MCLLFFNINNNCKNDEFRLILVNNRDEFWKRPAKAAGFWTVNGQTCISGLDQEPGREGGTWFGANDSGRIACLVNLAGPQDLTKSGRGFMVTDFLKGASSLQSFASEISLHKDEYNGFILTLIELGRQCSTVVQVTNDKFVDDAVHLSKPTAEDFFSVGNSSTMFPWRKVTAGREQFSQIVRDHRSLSAKHTLTDQLLALMSNKYRHIPDPHLTKTGQECKWPPHNVDNKAALFVWDPISQYGTRTTTVLLIDWEGNCDYREQNLHTPVDVDNPQWSTQHHHFKLRFADKPPLRQELCEPQQTVGFPL